jgi:hypothetical protein
MLVGTEDVSVVLLASGPNAHRYDAIALPATDVEDLPLKLKVFPRKHKVSKSTSSTALGCAFTSIVFVIESKHWFEVRVISFTV